MSKSFNFKSFLVFSLLIVSLICFTSQTSFAVPLTESTTGLKLEAPKKFTLTYNGGGSYTVKKKKSPTKANFVIGTSPLSAKMTADDFINSSGMNVKKYLDEGDSILLKGKLNKKSVQVRFRQVGKQMEYITYFGKKKKGKKKRSSRVPRLTAAEVRLLDSIIRSRQGGRVIPFPVTIPMRRVTASDGTTALVPNLPGWTASAGV
ncbi:MAG: hypothetical protein KDD56_04405, partial [Bdellovibrionales bacterium]|nr:hypothetical protein [Bdellovibrionales bacterium]